MISNPKLLVGPIKRFDQMNDIFSRARYEEGERVVYGEAAVQIGDTVYHFDEPEVEPGEPEQLPDPWRVEFQFAETLVACTGNQAGFNTRKAQFWVGTLDNDSATGEDNPIQAEDEAVQGERTTGEHSSLFHSVRRT